jgi:hypothetical protein
MRVVPIPGHGIPKLPAMPVDTFQADLGRVRVVTCLRWRALSMISTDCPLRHHDTGAVSRRGPFGTAATLFKEQASTMRIGCFAFESHWLRQADG